MMWRMILLYLKTWILHLIDFITFLVGSAVIGVFGCLFPFSLLSVLLSAACFVRGWMGGPDGVAALYVRKCTVPTPVARYRYTSPTCPWYSLT